MSRTNRQINSLFLTIENSCNKVSDTFNRNIFREEWKNEPLKSVFSIPAINTEFDRKIVFHTLKLDYPYSVYNPEAYTSVLDYVATLEKQNVFGFNTVLAIYNEVDNSTMFGYSPLHKNVVAISVKGKLFVSPNFFYAQQ